MKFSDITVIEDKKYLPKKNEVQLDYENIRSEIGINISNDEIFKISFYRKFAIMTKITT